MATIETPPHDLEAEFEDQRATAPKSTRRVSARAMILLRRIHLYAGLFLLPWVMLYGVTGAMFNHQGLFSEAHIQPVDAGVIGASEMTGFPTPEKLARDVVEAIQGAAGDVNVTLAEGHGAEFTNPIMFEAKASEDRHVFQIDPISHAARIATHPHNPETPEPLLSDLRTIQLDPDPHEMARAAAAHAFDEAGLTSGSRPQPLGWTKLNFLASVDGVPARITYVLKDGHVDITRYTGEDGMTPRHFFLRLHTSHGQSPHWNGRSIWSLIVDVMAIAMVTWALTGLVMWWQLKRTRILGSVVILLSLVAASGMYLGMLDFYATTKL